MTSLHPKPPRRILVTGFGPFPGVHDNPTARLVSWLAADQRWTRRAGVTVETAILPVAWGALPGLLAAQMAESDPDIVLHFGFHAAARGFTVEEWARNATAPMADACGVAGRARQVVPGAPRRLRAPSSAGRLAAHLKRRGLTACTSTDAGRYLCNMVFYLSLERRWRTGRPKLVHFIHIPPLSSTRGRLAPNALSREELRAGVGAIIGYNWRGQLRQGRRSRPEGGTA